MIRLAPISIIGVSRNSAGVCVPATAAAAGACGAPITAAAACAGGGSNGPLLCMRVRTLLCTTLLLKRSEPLPRCCVLPDSHRVCSRLGAGSKPQSQNKYEGEFSQVR